VTEQDIQRVLRPFDTMIYRPRGFFGNLIALKTWNKTAAHVEVYIGDSQSVASRDGKGVHVYPNRFSELAWLLRVKPHHRREFDEYKALSWLRTVDPKTGHSPLGQGYDWKGILVFTLAVKQGAVDKMFCSEFWTRFMRAGGLEPFQSHLDGTPTTDADAVAPATILLSSKFDVILSPEDIAGSWADFAQKNELAA
jgi:hypothetical protein